MVVHELSRSHSSEEWLVSQRVAVRMILGLEGSQRAGCSVPHSAQAAGMEVDISVADVAYPLVARRLIEVFQQQLVHIWNGCISDDPDHLPTCM